MLVVTLAPSLLGSILAGEATYEPGEGVIPDSEGQAFEWCPSFNLFWNTEMLLKQT